MNAVSVSVQKQYPLRKADVHPETGEALAFVSIVLDVDVVTLEVGPPRHPDAWVYAYTDDDEPYRVRRKTLAELQAAIVEYNRAYAAYVRTGGVERMPGRLNVSGTFTAASGSVVEGTWDGGKWVFTRWTI